MAEYFSIPSREEAERFSEAYLDAQRSYYDALEDRAEELFAAVRLIKEHCNSLDRCVDCCIRLWCWNNNSDQPFGWPDPEEGGGEDGV